MALADWISNPPTPATPATDATDKPQTRPTVASVASVAAPSGSESSWDARIGYTLADLKDFDRLLVELAEIEDWSEDELQTALTDRKRMAPVRVPGALQDIRKAHRAALAVWPNTPATRTRIALLEGWV